MHICTKYHAVRPFDENYAPEKHVKEKSKIFDLGFKGQGHMYSDLNFVHDTLLCLNAYMYQCINKQKAQWACITLSLACFHFQNCSKVFTI